MKTINLYLILFMLVTLFSCNNNDKGYKTTKLDKELLQNSDSLVVDTILNSDNLPRAQTFFYINDSVILIQNRKFENQSFLEFYNIHNNKIIKKLFKNGNGHDEMLSIIVNLENNRLLARDFIRNNYTIVNIDSLLTDSAYKSPFVFNGYLGISSLSLYKNEILAVNPYTFSCKEQNIEQDCGSKIVKLPALNKLCNSDHEYNTLNVAAQGEIVANDNEKIICYADFAQPYINIYNDKLELVKRYEGPDELSVEYAITDQKEVLYKKRIPYAYLKSCYNDKYFYLCYMGAYWESDVTVTMDNFPCYIFKFNWDGDFVKSYKSDRWIYALSCNPQYSGKDILYATINNANGIPTLVKLYEK